jgi:biopolymer transport protein ExbD
MKHNNMAQTENAIVQRQGKSLSRNRKQQLRIDMTPMVDLGFLLITFFVFTTTISSPAGMTLYLPSDKKVTHPNQLQNSLALTVLIDNNNRIWYYYGVWDAAKLSGEIFETGYSSYSGIGKVIRLKQKSIDDTGTFTEGSKGLMLIIKPSANSAYRNLIDILDEVLINDVKKYAVVELSEEELDFLRSQGNNSSR